MNKASSFVCLWLQFFFESMTRESERVYRSYEHRTAHNLSQDFININNARLTIVLIHLIQPCLQHICNRMSCRVSGYINFHEYSNTLIGKVPYIHQSRLLIMKCYVCLKMFGNYIYEKKISAFDLPAMRNQ